MDPSLCSLVVGIVFAAVGVICHIATKDRELKHSELKKVVSARGDQLHSLEGEIVALCGIPQIADCAPLISPFGLVSLIKYKVDRYVREIVYNPVLKILDKRIVHTGSELFDVPFKINGVFICELHDKIKYRNLHEIIEPLSEGRAFDDGKVLDVIYKYSGVQATTRLTAIGKVVKDSHLDQYSLVSAGYVSCISDKTLNEQIAEVAPCALDYAYIGAYAISFGAFAFMIVSGRNGRSLSNSNCKLGAGTAPSLR